MAQGVGEQEEPDQAEEPQQPLPGAPAEVVAQPLQQPVGPVPEGQVRGQQGQRGSTKIRL